MTRLDELEVVLRSLYRKQNDLDAEVRTVKDEISSIKQAASEWKVGQRVRWDKKEWQVVGISSDGQKPVIKQFLKSGKVGVLTKEAWWFRSESKPVVLSEPEEAA